MLHDRDIAQLLARLCPMHLAVDEQGRVMHIGPTLAKLLPDKRKDDACLFDLIEVRRPSGVCDMQALLARQRQKLSLRLRGHGGHTLKGVFMAVPGQGGILDLSFGIAIMDGVRDFELSASDFAVTDLAIEMLYLIEAKSAAMEVSRKLNQRLQGAKIAAEEQAFTDTLTGLKNRRAVDHVLPRLIDRGEAVTLMQVDLDYFKAVNDTHGHPAGDHVLQSVAHVLVQETRQGDCVARVGGDEFVIILVGEVEEAAVAHIAERLIARIEAPIRWRGETCEISASIGIATNAFGSGEAGETLWARADTALYAAKNGGRGRFRMA